MQHAPYQIANVLPPDACETLLAYINHDDDRTDCRPDVRSKHPRWSDHDWPRDTLQRALDQVLGTNYQVEEITFQSSRIALKPHTDNWDPPNAKGITVMFLLEAEPEAHTIFFHQRLKNNHRTGAFFQRSEWNRYSYRWPRDDGGFVWIEDLRQFRQQCHDNPGSVTDFDVTDALLDQLDALIVKRSLPQLEPEQKNQRTGYIQPAPRIKDYSVLDHFAADQDFDQEFHARYLSRNRIEDLHGLTVESVITWQPGAAIVFDRCQVHSSSDCHHKKSFVTVFCHRLQV